MLLNNNSSWAILCKFSWQTGPESETSAALRDMLSECGHLTTSRSLCKPVHLFKARQPLNAMIPQVHDPPGYKILGDLQTPLGRYLSSCLGVKNVKRRSGLSFLAFLYTFLTLASWKNAIREAPDCNEIGASHKNQLQY